MRFVLLTLRVLIGSCVSIVVAPISDVYAQENLVARLKFDGDLSIEGSKSLHATFVNHPVSASFLGDRWSVDGYSLKLEEIKIRPHEPGAFVLVSGFSTPLPEVTFTFWLHSRLIDVPGDGIEVLRFGDHSQAQTSIHRLWLNKNGTFEVILDSGGLNETRWSTSRPVVNDLHERWLHVAYSFSTNKGRLQLAVDGQSVLSDTVHRVTIPNENGPLTIASSGFNGRFDEFRVYDRQLNLKEIQSIIDEHAASIRVEKVMNGYKIMVTNPDLRTFKIVRSFDLLRWSDLFLVDRTQPEATFLDSVDPAVANGFYKIQFPR